MMKGFINGILSLMNHKDGELARDEVKLMVAETLGRECDDDEFLELINVLGLDTLASVYTVAEINHSIRHIQSRDNCDENDPTGDDFLDLVDRQSPDSENHYTILDEGDDGEEDDFFQVIEGSEESDRLCKLNELEYLGNDEDVELSRRSSQSLFGPRSANSKDQIGGEEEPYTIDVVHSDEEDDLVSPVPTGYMAEQTTNLEQSLEDCSIELEELKIAHRRLLEAYSELEDEAKSKAEEQEEVISELSREYEAALASAGIPICDDDSDLFPDPGGMGIIPEEDETSLELERVEGDISEAAQQARVKRRSNDRVNTPSQPQRHLSADALIKSLLKSRPARSISANTVLSQPDAVVMKECEELRNQTVILTAKLADLASREEEAERDLSSMMEEFSAMTAAKEAGDRALVSVNLQLAEALAKQEAPSMIDGQESLEQENKNLAEQVAALEASLAQTKNEAAAKVTYFGKTLHQSRKEAAEKVAHLEALLKDRSSSDASNVVVPTGDEIQLLKDQLAASEKARQDSREVLAAYIQKGDGEANDGLKQENENLTEQVAALEASLSEAKDEAAAKVTYFGKTLHQSRKEAAEKVAQLEALLKDKEESSALEELQAKLAEFERVRAELEEAAGEKDRDESCALEELQVKLTESERVRAELEEAAGEKDREESCALEELRAKLAESERVIVELEEAAGEKDKEESSALEELQAKLTESERMRVDLEEAAGEKDREESSALEELQAKLAESERVRVELEEAAGEKDKEESSALEELQAKLAESERMRAELEEAAGEKDRDESCALELQAKLAESERVRVEVEAQLTETQSSSAGEASDGLKQENENLREQVAALEASLSEAKDEAAAKVTYFGKTLHQSRKEAAEKVANLEALLKDREESSALEELQAKFAESERVRVELEEAAGEKDREESSALEELQAKLTESERMRVELEAQLTETQSSCDGLKQENENLTEQVAVLEASLSEAKDEAAAKVTYFGKTLHQSRKEAAAKVANLEALLKDKEESSALEELQVKLAESERVRVELEEAAGEKDKKESSALEELQAKLAESERVRVELEEAAGEKDREESSALEELQAKLTESERMRVELEPELLTSSQGEMQELKEKLAALERIRGNQELTETDRIRSIESPRMQERQFGHEVSVHSAAMAAEEGLDQSLEGGIHEIVAMSPYSIDEDHEGRSAAQLGLTPVQLELDDGTTDFSPHLDSENASLKEALSRALQGKEDQEDRVEELLDQVAMLESSESEMTALRLELAMATQTIKSYEASMPSPVMEQTDKEEEDDDDRNDIRGAGSELANKLKKQRDRINQKSPSSELGLRLSVRGLTLEDASTVAWCRLATIPERAKHVISRTWNNVDSFGAALNDLGIEWSGGAVAETMLKGDQSGLIKLESMASGIKVGASEFEQLRNLVADLEESMLEKDWLIKQVSAERDDMKVSLGELHQSIQNNTANTSNITSPDPATLAAVEEERDHLQLEMVDLQCQLSSALEEKGIEVDAVRGRSPAAAFDLLKRTQTIDSLRRSNATLTAKCSELLQRTLRAEAKLNMLDESSFLNDLRRSAAAFGLVCHMFKRKVISHVVRQFFMRWRTTLHSSPLSSVAVQTETVSPLDASQHVSNLETSRLNQDADMSATSVDNFIHAFRPPPNEAGNSNAKQKVSSFIGGALHREMKARVLALETTNARQAAYITGMRVQRDWLWPLLNFPIVYWMARVTGEFRVFILAFLCTATALALAARLGLLNQLSNIFSFINGQNNVKESEDNKAGASAVQPRLILERAQREYELSSGLALVALVAFFGYVVFINPLDEAEYYFLGYCNPLLYGLPFVLQYAFSPERKSMSF